MGCGPSSQRAVATDSGLDLTSAHTSPQPGEVAVSARFEAALKAGLSSPDAGVKLRSAVKLIQRMSRGTIGRWVEDNQLSFELSNALESIEEAEGIRVAEFLSHVDVHAEDVEEPEAKSGPSSGPSSPRGPGSPSFSKQVSIGHTSGPEEMRLTFPLSEAAVLHMLEGFCRGVRLSVDSVHKLLQDEAALLSGLPNVHDVTIADATPLTVVGDLHGQLRDMLHCFRASGFPSEARPFLFNGDFVDRGEHGCE